MMLIPGVKRNAFLAAARRFPGLSNLTPDRVVLRRLRIKYL